MFNFILIYKDTSATLILQISNWLALLYTHSLHFAFIYNLPFTQRLHTRFASVLILNELLKGNLTAKDLHSLPACLIIKGNTYKVRHYDPHTGVWADRIGLIDVRVVPLLIIMYRAPPLV